MNLVFYFLAVVLMFYSFKSLRGGFSYLNYFRRELARPKSNYTPCASIIAPCRGLDAHLFENLSALFRQDFPAYEILFVVDSETDAAVEIIKKVMAQNSRAAKLIVAGRAENESQKVHNLREAVLRAAENSRVFVFVDSDARPDENWLGSLIAPLESGEIGAATGYRWFISERGNFASELRSAWNASVASALGAEMKSNFCWGGATAMRREVFEKTAMREYWRGVLSDDFALTRRLKECGLPIYFVPQALTASIEDCSPRELFEFTNRQMKITRVYAPHLWLASLLGAFLFNLVLVWAIFMLIFSPFHSFAFIFAVFTICFVGICSTGKSHLRLKAVRLSLKKHEKHLRKQNRRQNALWILSSPVFLWNSCAALLSRRIVWRGIEYELKSPRETLIVSRHTTQKRLISSDG